jgi:hypothetical protein
MPSNPDLTSSIKKVLIIAIHNGRSRVIERKKE